MINLYIRNRKIFFLVLGLFSVFVILFLLRVLTSKPVTEPTPSSLPKASLSATSFPLASFQGIPLVSPLPSVRQEKVYSSQDLEKDFQRISNPKPLSTEDSKIRADLIQSLGNKSGYLVQQSNFRIEYVKGPDEFMVEILSEEAEQAKDESIKWFKDKGLSNEGVCNLPVSIYLNSAVKNNLEAKGIAFSPIPEGC